jgi:hypothetical protein
MHSCGGLGAAVIVSSSSSSPNNTLSKYYDCYHNNCTLGKECYQLKKYIRLFKNGRKHENLIDKNSAYHKASRLFYYSIVLMFYMHPSAIPGLNRGDGAYCHCTNCIFGNLEVCSVTFIKSKHGHKIGYLNSTHQSAVSFTLEATIPITSTTCPIPIHWLT